jgi:hypothetical protein
MTTRILEWWMSRIGVFVSDSWMAHPHHTLKDTQTLCLSKS